MADSLIACGVDIGSSTSKVVILRDSEILGYSIVPTGAESVNSAHKALDEVLVSTGLSLEQLGYVVATGYGRIIVPFAHETVTELTCHARGANWLFPSARTILDMGGQDCKAISCNENGRVVNFIMNDKCAGGTGRFLEMIAEVLNVPLQEIGGLSLESQHAILFNTICAVFAKTEAISYLRNGIAKSDILAGLHEAIATRSLNLLKRVSIQQDFSITGGIAKNRGMVEKLKEKVGLEPLLCEDPQIIGALGAALFARERSQQAAQADRKVHYGYSDATGNYFITIDEARCDGCGKCVDACPAGVFEIAGNDNGQARARVTEEARKRLALLCPGFDSCSRMRPANCHSVCRLEAISHSWDGAGDLQALPQMEEVL